MERLGKAQRRRVLNCVRDVAATALVDANPQVYGDRARPAMAGVVRRRNVAPQLRRGEAGAAQRDGPGTRSIESKERTLPRHQRYASRSSTASTNQFKVDGIYDARHDDGVPDAGLLRSTTATAASFAARPPRTRTRMLCSTSSTCRRTRAGGGAAASGPRAWATSTSCCATVATTGAGRATRGLVGRGPHRWLEGHLRASAAWARATVVVSPVQVLATKERRPPASPGFFEFPDDRALASLLANRSALIVSGNDVHYAETLGVRVCAGRPHRAGDDDVGPLARVGLAAPGALRRPRIHRAKHFAMAVHQRVLQWPGVWQRHRVDARGALYLGLNAGEVEHYLGLNARGKWT